MFKKFKEFALGGNIFDMAIGVLMGTAIGKVVSALVEQIFMPLIGLAIGKIDFKSIAITIGDTTFGIGIFIQEVVSFLITALILFFIVQGLSKATEISKKIEGKEDVEEEEKEKEPTTEELLKDIKVLLENQNKKIEK